LPGPVQIDPAAVALQGRNDMLVDLLDRTSIGKSGIEIGASGGGVDSFFGSWPVLLGLMSLQGAVGFQKEILLFGFDKIDNDFQSFALMIILDNVGIPVGIIIVEHQMLDQESVQFLLDG